MNPQSTSPAERLFSQLATFPLYAIVQTPEGPRCACGDPRCGAVGKHPAIKWKDLGKGEKAPKWHHASGNGWGIATGERSGVIVIETDTTDGEAWLAPRVPRTLKVRSGSAKGYHRYFVWPGFPIKTSAGELHEGVDVRGDGGQAVAPGSPHKSGGRYEVVDDVDVAELPPSLVEWFKADSVPARKPAKDPATAPYAPVTHAGDCTAEDPVLDAALVTMHPDGRGTWIVDEIGEGKFSCRCPNEAEHTSHNETSTVIWRGGVLHCSHSHCSHIRKVHLARAMGLYIPEYEGWPEVEAHFAELDARMPRPVEAHAAIPVIEPWMPVHEGLSPIAPWSRPRRKRIGGVK